MYANWRILTWEVRLPSLEWIILSLLAFCDKILFWWNLGFSGSGNLDVDGNFGFGDQEILNLMSFFVFGVRSFWFWWKWGFRDQDILILKRRFSLSGHVDFDGTLGFRGQETLISIGILVFGIRKFWLWFLVWFPGSGNFDFDENFVFFLGWVFLILMDLFVFGLSKFRFEIWVFGGQAFLLWFWKLWTFN